MDEKRQRSTQNAAPSAHHGRPGESDAQRASQRTAGDRPPKLGEILVAQGKITQEQLAVALERQKTSGRRLGEELIKAGFVKRAVISQALRMQRRIVFGAMTTLAATSIIPDLATAAQHSQMAVTAVVPSQAVGQVVQQAAEITITDADIARGYIDVPTGSQLNVKSNNPAGYVVDFFTRLPIFSSVRVSNGSGSAELGPDGGTIVERGQIGRNLSLALTYRFILASSVQPGTYPWPLALNVRAL